jgi:hypothetical protein
MRRCNGLSAGTRTPPGADGRQKTSAVSADHKSGHLAHVNLVNIAVYVVARIEVVQLSGQVS